MVLCAIVCRIIMDYLVPKAPRSIDLSLVYQLHSLVMTDPNRVFVRRLCLSPLGDIALGRDAQ